MVFRQIDLCTSFHALFSQHNDYVKLPRISAKRYGGLWNGGLFKQSVEYELTTKEEWKFSPCLRDHHCLMSKFDD